MTDSKEKMEIFNMHSEYYKTNPNKATKVDIAVIIFGEHTAYTMIGDIKV